MRYERASSTRLIHAKEREALMKLAMPVLRAVCAAKGLALTEVDLRWGISGVCELA